MPYLIVFLGAGLGGALRHGVNVAAARLVGYGFPAGTFFVNVAGSFLVGILAGYFVHRTGVPQHVRLFLVTGILGGFTTFSAFSLETALLLEREKLLWAASYAAGSVLACIAAVFAGLLMFRTSGQLP